MSNNIVEKLIEKLIELTSVAQRRELIVFGSTAIVLNKVPRDKAPDDLDVYASKAVLEALKATDKFEVHRNPKGEGDGYVTALKPKDGTKIEILDEFPSVGFTEVQATAWQSPEYPGVLVGSIPLLLAWKRNQKRIDPVKAEQDKKDIAAMEAALLAASHNVDG